MSSTSSLSIIPQKPQTPIIFSLLHNSPLSISTPCNLRFPPLTRTFIVNTSKSPNFSSQSLLYAVSRAQPEEEDESAIGDCLVYEEGIFDDPFLRNTQYLRNDGVSVPPVRKSNSKGTTDVSPEKLIPDKWLDVQREINISNKERQNDDVSAPRVRKSNSKDTTDFSPENLIPDKWLDVQREISISNKERRKLSQQLEYDARVEKRRQALRPINSNSEEFKKFKNEMLGKPKPLVLDNPEPARRLEENDNKFEEKRGDDERRSREVVTGRVAPRDPRLAVYGRGLEDISAVFSSRNYDHGAAEKSQGTRKLFSKEEKLLMNRQVPDLAVAISGKWHPLHTLAASGEFYLVISLLKHNLDINAPDKNGLTAIHKAIIGRKQAIFNFLLRESANPFVRDNEGATLMHYAVFTASTQMIKILLLYNVDINLQDNDGWTPLHLAVQSRRTDIVRLLLIKGADKSLKNRNGFTALDLCLYSGRDTRTYEVIKQLKLLP